jgi:hypothetical protein
VAVPILIFVVCLAGGAWAGGQWLPNLASGPVGGLAFFAVCGLFGTALALAGINIYEIANSLNRFHAISNAEVVTSGARGLLFDSGSVFGLAMVVYLLAPPTPEPLDSPESDAAPD